ncbi:hypothetical protein Tco_1504475 [Tanacetum coccineum]
MPSSNQMDYKRTKVYQPRIHRSNTMDEDLRKSYRTLENRLFHEGRFVTPSFIEVNNMLPTFQAVDLASFLTLDEPICPRFITEFYHSLEFKRDEEDILTLNSSLHDLVKRNITIPRATQNKLQRDPNKLYLDDLHPELRGWALFFRENFFCTLGNRDHVNACTAYMLYYLTIKRKFNFTTVILYRIEEIKNKSNAPMPFAMLLTHLYKYLFQTNPQSIVPLARFTFHECVMNPLDIL